MDSLPPQDIMDIIASVVLFPKPSNVLNPKRNSIEYFIHITERISKSSYHGIVGGCVFCGHNRKWTAAQIRIHFTKEKEGATHVHECPKVPPQITRYYREIRDAFVSQQEQKSGRNVALLRKEMLQVQSPKCCKCNLLILHHLRNRLSLGLILLDPLQSVNVLLMTPSQLFVKHL